MNEMSRNVRLTIPADQTYAPVATLALSGLGMIAGLDVDLLGDLRTVVTEALDCLLNQAGRPECIQICAGMENCMLRVQFCAQNRCRVQEADELDMDITRAVLETLIPQVELTLTPGGCVGQIDLILTKAAV